MHEYSIDVEHNKVLFYLAAASIILSGLLTTLLNLLIEYIPFSGFTISIAAIGLFGLLYTMFDKYAWKLKFFKNIGVVKTPDLNGIWKGEYQSSFHEFRESFEAKLVIEQTWSKICISGTFHHSKSSSYTAAIKTNSGGGIKLIYSYYNDKNPQHHKLGMSNHRGYSNVEIIEDTMHGYYFNDPTNNTNHGTLKLTRINSN